MTATRPLEMEPLPDTTFGAVITGIDLANLSGAMWARIDAAFNEYGVLIFPAQHLAAEAQAAFARRFGPLEDGGLKRGDGARSISNRSPDETVLTEQDPTWLTLSYPTRHWHMDGTFNPVPPKIGMLSAVSVPSRDGQTGFADMRAAYDALDQPTRERIAGLSAYHSNLIGTTRVLPRRNQQDLASLVGDAPEDGHYGLGYRADAPLRPLVKYHPVTGRPSLFVGRHAFGVPGMTPEESERLLSRLDASACRPPRVYEHEWQIGDLIVFDNRRMLHRALPYDDQGEARELLNCRIAGDAETDSGLATVEAQRSVEVQRAELARLRGRAVHN
ncbi:MAG: TauD/TfdA family dioxygenase [Gammaproteobacteria bacterium]|nr:TauD/TfdA family dioxygenase [Gammaproteobacteria bacterium]